ARGAEAARRLVIEISEKRLSSLSARADRRAVVDAAGKAYRGLAADYWDRDADHDEALRLWEWFRAAEWPGPRTLKLETRGLGAETIVAYAELPTGMVVWAYDNRGIRGQRLNVAKVELEKTVQRFLRLCSDPGSNEAALRNDGRQLYDWLIAPIEQHL